MPSFENVSDETIAEFLERFTPQELVVRRFSETSMIYKHRSAQLTLSIFQTTRTVCFQGGLDNVLPFVSMFEEIQAAFLPNGC